ncbi:unnamed protein product, partial [Polarella glacialis]
DDDELVIWAGLVLRRTPRCILERCGESVAPRAGGVFVQTVVGGSPADTREIHPYCFLMEIDGHPIRQLSDVLQHGHISAAAPQAGEGSPSCQSRGAWVRLQLLDMNGQEHVRAIQHDPLFFPTLDLWRNGSGRWQCTQRG